MQMESSLFEAVKPTPLKLGVCEIQIGTSGYVFADWKGVFYPESLPSSSWLNFYAQEFNVVEINATYYRLPPAKTFRSMASRTRQEFGFWVKLPGGVTHSDEEPEPLITQFNEAIQPLVEARQYKGALAQFPPSFKLNSNSFNKLESIAKSTQGPLAVEFRRMEWQDDKVYQFLRDLNIVYVTVDTPDLEGLPKPNAEVTARIGYIRFHGRNKRAWYNRNAGDRYNYDYCPEELSEWLPRLKIMSEHCSTIYIFFNNCHAGQAVRSAKMLRNILQTEFGTLN